MLQLQLKKCTGIKIVTNDNQLIYIFIFIINMILEKYTSSLKSFLTLLSYSIGLGNVWRFPYLCAMHGGITFITAYLIVALLIGIPTVCLHISLGQLYKLDSITIFTDHKNKTIKKLYGFGYSLIILLPIATYLMIMGYCLNYLVFYSEEIEDVSQFSADGEDFNYFNQVLLNSTNNLFDFGRFNFRIASHFAAVLFTIWFFFSGILRSKSIKIMEFNAIICCILPYSCLLYILYICLSEFNQYSMDGIKFLFKGSGSTSKNPLLSYKIYKDATSQVIFSSGAQCSYMITLSAFSHSKDSKSEKKIIKKSLGIILGNLLTSIFACVVVYATLGILMGHQENGVTDINQLNQDIGGPGLIFQTIPMVFKFTSFPKLIKVLFFSSCFALGMGTAIPTWRVGLETLKYLFLSTDTSNNYDQNDSNNSIKFYRAALQKSNLLYILICFLIGFTMCFQNSVFMLYIYDSLFFVLPAIISNLTYNVIYCSYQPEKNNYLQNLVSYILNDVKWISHEIALKFYRYVLPVLYGVILVSALVDFAENDVFGSDPRRIYVQSYFVGFTIVGSIPIIYCYFK